MGRHFVNVVFVSVLVLSVSPMMMWPNYKPISKQKLSSVSQPFLQVSGQQVPWGCGRARSRRASNACLNDRTTFSLRLHRFYLLNWNHLLFIVSWAEPNQKISSPAFWSSSGRYEKFKDETMRTNRELVVKLIANNVLGNELVDLGSINWVSSGIGLALAICPVTLTLIQPKETQWETNPFNRNLVSQSGTNDLICE